jgi:hypothetical protein
MNRIDPNFKENSIFEQENKEFINEFLLELFDRSDIDSDTDSVPDLSILNKVR